MCYNFCMKRIKVFLANIALFLLPASQALAAGPAGGPDITLPDPLGGATIPSIITNVFDFLVQAAAVVAPILIVVGAFQMITSAGSPEKFSRGQKTILYTAIGFVVVLMARGIVAIVESVIS